MANSRPAGPAATDLHAIVDMGSNGIRFSISNLSESTARLLPTIYQSRAAISIYDAQHDESGKQIPIPVETISSTIASLESFLRTCQKFNVSPENIRVLATEATRTAPNSNEFREQIKTATGLTVQLLSKEDEGRIGAMGIASSFPAPIQGVVLDLGGGSVQISWVRLAVGGELQRSASAVSMPYGAAAMMGRLTSGTKPEDLSSEIAMSFRDALQQLNLPPEMLGEHGDGLTLYLSGGGFRGWGYTLMERHTIQPYPIPIINGLSVDAKQFHPQFVLAKDFSNPVTDDIFRISERRASQAPAVALLITSLLAVLPRVSTVHFAQGGVREGSLYSKLPVEIQSQNPLVAATSPYATSHRDQLAGIFQAAIPQNPIGALPSYLGSSYSREALTLALASLLNHFRSFPKDVGPSAALRSTTTGILASTHGLTHESRAWLALALLGQWGTGREDLPKSEVQFYDGLCALLGGEAAWWAGYIGRIAGVVSSLFPAGLVTGTDAGWTWKSQWNIVGKKGASALRLTISPVEDENLKKALKEVVKWGKKKKWDQRLVKGYKVIINGLEEDDSD